MKYFVFGANGYVGRYLYDRLKEDNEEVVGTSYKANEEHAYYDIKENIMPVIIDECHSDNKVAIICIAKANINYCYAQFQNSYDVNVKGMKKLITSLLERGFYIIYFSSDCVFDGVNGNYTEQSERHPINKYGEMKAEMEKYIVGNNLPIAVFRITRVVSPRPAKQNPFSQLSDVADKGIIRCIKGNRLSYVSVEDIYQVCRIAAKKKMYGLYNLCGSEVYSRKELAEKYLTRIGRCNKEIKEIDVNEFGFQDGRPLDVSMDNHKIQSETGHKFASMDEVIDQYIQLNLVDVR
ncbi:MAG: sugar nucleotide-binding protein [Ruminococcus flavefaciens]|nr:sugar nucleotide-binding protein [Ruminococcus flavefaciens]